MIFRHWEHRQYRSVISIHVYQTVAMIAMLVSCLEHTFKLFPGLPRITLLTSSPFFFGGILANVKDVE
jgi:hypothetical protein